jgi:hypothetical protein
MAAFLAEDLPESFAKISLEDKWDKNQKYSLCNYHCQQQYDPENPGEAFMPDSITFPGFELLPPKEQHHLTDYCRICCRNLDQQQRGVLLQVCSWNPGRIIVVFAAGTLTNNKEESFYRCAPGTRSRTKNFATGEMRDQPFKSKDVSTEHWESWPPTFSAFKKPSGRLTIF